MSLLVESLDADAARIGLTEEAIQAAAESLLRAARLYRREAFSYLYINVNVTERAHGIRLEFSKLVYDYASELTFNATTWDVGSTGTHGGDGSYILSNISEQLDQFLVEYLRVNEEACEKR